MKKMKAVGKKVANVLTELFVLLWMALLPMLIVCVMITNGGK